MKISQGRPFLTVLAIICTLIVPLAPRAATFPHAYGVIGELRQYKIGPNESLVELARKFDLGFNEIVKANPDVDPFIPMPGAIITIPAAWIPPAASKRPAIVVNIPEFRLYYFPKGSSSVVTFPLGIGDEGRDTPVGSYTVIEKIVNPAWNVPKSIRAQTPGLAKIVPPGPDNPMGSHALRLSLESVLIHGTNRPWGIGRRSSHGCLRLYPEDIVRLFRLVPIGTRVIIVNQPVKVAARGKRVFVQVHQYKGEESVGRAMHMLANRNLLGRTDFALLIRAMRESRGVPIDVTLTFAAAHLRPSAGKP